MEHCDAARSDVEGEEEGMVTRESKEDCVDAGKALVLFSVNMVPGVALHAIRVQQREM